MLDATAPSARRPATVMVTGFDPFGGSEVNPSYEAVLALHGQEVAGHRVVGVEVPTVFGLAIERLYAAMDEHQPRLVIVTGQAAGRAALSLERVAINVNDARIPDNRGAQPIDTAVIPEAPAAYFTSLPIKATLQALLDAGINAEVSQTAGTFVCNHTFYGLMHRLADPAWRGTRGGMIHVPYLPQQGQPSMRLVEIVEGLKLAVACALSVGQDIRKEAGAIA